ncbi:fungal specific transcription factor domain-containing protein [Aspergillus stella-maris]|uniref:fungal specific transcription factor domain-containing protein n=1 Tax=Aspergillus stella-maris TaxID=1810926 RepID=UPI003CCCB183
MPSILPSFGADLSIPCVTSLDFPRDADTEDLRCWTCKIHDIACDMALPGCRSCDNENRACGGYGLRMRWPAADILLEFKSVAQSFGIANYQLSQFGLPSKQSFYLQHLSKNLARVGLAMDYEGNGYCKWIQVATSDNLLLETMLAVTISHYARWQGQESLNDSHSHYKQALKQLRDRLQDPVMVRNESTLAAMMFLISYEVFSGSDRWKRHQAGVLAWIRAFESQTRLDPFLKTWFSMVNTQSALNSGIPVAPQVEFWLTGLQRDASIVDPFFGCSTSLPSIMLRASKLYLMYRTATAAGMSIGNDTRRAAEELKQKLATSVASTDKVQFEITCAVPGRLLSPIQYLTQKEIFARASAVAEIFRYAMLIYVLRILHPLDGSPVPDIQQAVSNVIDLLPLVPDVLGPGSNLGWAFVVVGAELDEEEHREYIWGRLQGLHSLALGNVWSAEKVLQAAWKNRDEAKLGKTRYREWQLLMQDLGVEQILI